MSRNRLWALLCTAALTLAGTATAAADTPPRPERALVGAGTGLAVLRGGPLTDHAVVYMCTLTAIGYDAAGNLIGLTNAHCEYDGDQQWLGDLVLLQSEAFAPGATVPDLHLLGRVEYISGGNPVVPGPNGPGLDYAVIVFDKSTVEPVTTVGETTVRNLGAPPRTAPRCANRA